MECNMSDVLARLMQWIEASDIDDADAVLRDAITEIAGLRARLDELRLARLTLTDEEREAIACAAESYADNDDDEDCARVAATLRGVIERLG
jgi:hypothetical protein